MTDSDSAYHTRPSLLLRIKDARDDRAWAAFVEVYAPLVYRYCRRKGLQDFDAADVSQEVLTQVARSIRGFEYDPGRGRFRDWLGAVTHSKLMNHLRAERRTRREANEGGEPPAGAVVEAGPGPEWASEFNAHVLRTALQRIRPHFEPATWRAFEMVWLEGLKAAEAAERLGIPIDAVYVAKSRALKRLRDEVKCLAEDQPLYVPLT